MKIESIQKAIKVGPSLAVTIPAKDARLLGIKQGDIIRSTFEPVKEDISQKAEVVALTQKLIERHRQALKNLSQR